MIAFVYKKKGISALDKYMQCCVFPFSSINIKLGQTLFEEPKCNKEAFEKAKSVAG